MNNVQATKRLNELELQHGSTGASWHDEFKDSAYVYVGGLDTELTEGDVITIMSQFGEVANVSMPRNKQTSKLQGFAFLMYEDQRSTVLAVDNLNGAMVLGRTLRVDHVKDYKHLEQGEDGKMKPAEVQSLNALPENFMNQEEDESDSSHASIDPDDPMAAYLLTQRKEKKRKRSSKHDGETKEERRARKELKKAKKRALALAAGGGDEDSLRGSERRRPRRDEVEEEERPKSRRDEGDRRRDEPRRDERDYRREESRRDDRERREREPRRDERDYRRDDDRRRRD